MYYMNYPFSEMHLKNHIYWQEAIYIEKYLFKPYGEYIINITSNLHLILEILVL